ncbi:MAG: BatA domain-containing protein [Nitrospinae bacterium]|nr:BatA domain-containing protein [Nitrospinota bacterium]MBL7020335.1 BatA domain-containing protein [Nitrospinaceae bacterium]
MNLNFSSPLFLFGLLGVSIPVLIHLLTRRQQKQIRFSAVYLLAQSQKRSIRKSRPNRLLLLLARCLAIALFSLALANPLFSFRTTEGFLSTSPASIVFILDDSYSMGTRSKEKTLFDHALKHISEGLQHTPDNSEFSMVLASSPARIEQDWTSDKPAFANKLKAQAISFRTTHIGDTIAKAIKLLESAKQKKKKILLLTDLDKNGWKEETFSRVATPYPVQVLDFSPLQSDNNKGMVQSIQISQEFLTRSRLLRVKAEVKNFSSTVNRMSLSLFLEGKLVKEELLDIPPGQTLVQKFSYPLTRNQPLNGKAQISDDALPIDNSRYFPFHPSQNIQVLVVDGDPETISHQSESFYLERALNPFSVSLSHIDPTVSTLAELTLRNLSDFAVVILANVRELPPNYELELEKFVLNGGALLFGMGDQVDAKYFNEHLGNILPVKLEAQHRFKEDALHLLLKNNTHPVMRVFSPKALEEMRGINFYSMYTVQAREDKKFKVGTWFSNQHPAVIESETGKGIVVMFLSSLDRDWNDFPIQPTYLPWIQRWTQYAARGLENISQQNLLVGEPFRKNTTDNKWIIRAPDGTLHSLESEVFSDTFQPGIYRLFSIPPDDTVEHKALTKLPQGAEPIGTFTVNIDTQESEPGKISQKEIKNLLKGMELEFLDPKTQTTQSKTTDGIPLATPFLLMVAGMLLIEGWMVRKE